MNFAKLLLDVSYGNYSCKDFSDVAMSILGFFFATDVGLWEFLGFKDWALVSEDGDICGGNCTVLEKERDDILLSDEFPVESVPTKLRMTTKQFVQLFDEWQSKVVKLRPKEVLIKYEHGQFFIETSD